MNRAEILSLLPYGTAFLWLDTVTLIDPGRSIRAQMTYSPENPVLAAHFADGPKIVPGCIITEQICQAALLLAKAANMPGQGETYVLGRVQAAYEHSALMPCSVECEVSIRSSASRVLAILGRAAVRGVGPVARVKALAKPVVLPA